MHHAGLVGTHELPGLQPVGDSGGCSVLLRERQAFARFGIYEPAFVQQLRAQRQGLSEEILLVRRIEKDDVETLAALDAVVRHGEGVGAQHTYVVRLELVLDQFELAHDGTDAVDHRDGARAAAGRLEAEGAAAGEQVEAVDAVPAAGHLVVDPVEDGFTDAVGRGAQAEGVEDQHKARYKKALEQLELWFGSFSRDQEAALRKASDARPLDNEVWLQERVLRQKKIIALLQRIQRDKLNKEQTMAAIHDLLRDLFDRMDAPERKAFFDAYVDNTSKFILTAIRLTTPDQKALAQKRMQGWINDFNALASGK